MGASVTSGITIIAGDWDVCSTGSLVKPVCVCVVAGSGVNALAAGGTTMATVAIGAGDATANGDVSLSVAAANTLCVTCKNCSRTAVRIPSGIL